MYPLQSNAGDNTRTASGVNAAETMRSQQRSFENSLGLLMPNSLEQQFLDDMGKDKSTLEIERITTEWIHCINRRDWTNPCWEQHIADDFEFSLEYLDDLHLTGRKRYVEEYKTFTKKLSKYQVEILHLSTTPREKEGSATSWALLRVTGASKGAQREVLLKTHWRRYADTWAAYQQTGIRSAGFSI